MSGLPSTSALQRWRVIEYLCKYIGFSRHSFLRSLHLVPPPTPIKEQEKKKGQSLESVYTASVENQVYFQYPHGQLTTTSNYSCR